MKKLPICKYLELSTAHIKPETDEFIMRQAENEYGDLIVYPKECGYFIYVSYDEFFDEIKTSIPEDLSACLELARENDCYWLVLDGAAEVIDGLETYEW